MNKEGGLVGFRKASAKNGDDTTLSRFVKITGTADEKLRHKTRQPRLPGMEPVWVQEGRTKFPKAVKDHRTGTRILKSGHNNAKIGRDVRKGKLKGYWIYTLSFEERKTCPTSCSHWQSCYGNNMPFADRFDHTAPGFLAALAEEIRVLCQSKAGVLIRLHALGDFYSSGYVGFWWRMLAEHSNLAVFGYTAHQPVPGFAGDIGTCIDFMNGRFPDRCWIRFSNGGRGQDCTVTIGREESRPKNAFICPEQTRKSAYCATCSACWSTRKNVAFLEH